MNLKNAVAAASVLLALGSCLAGELQLTERTQVLRLDAMGHNPWEVATALKSLRAEETAIIICDMWDKHWSRGANERVAAMVPRMNDVVRAARARG